MYGGHSKEMGLKPGGANKKYFHFVRFRKIELLQDKSSLTLEGDGSLRTLVLDKDYVMGDDAFSSDAKVEGPGRLRRFQHEHRRSSATSNAGIIVIGTIRTVLCRAPWKNASRPGGPFFFLRTETAHRTEHGEMGLNDYLGPASQNSGLRFQNTYVFRRSKECGRWMTREFRMMSNRKSKAMPG